MSNGGTQEARQAGDWKCRFKLVGWSGWQIRRIKSEN